MACSVRRKYGLSVSDPGSHVSGIQMNAAAASGRIAA
jgi:hypothetical protein